MSEGPPIFDFAEELWGKGSEEKKEHRQER